MPRIRCRARQNEDKKATVLEIVIKVSDAVSQTSRNLEVQTVGAIIDVVATAVNTLMSKTPAASAAQ
jgi:hypothetical protein